MTLHLRIENETSLPDGGPLEVAVSGGRGVDIGRDRGLGWTLPDPTRTISGRHCEIAVRDGEYWLRDVSRNGTFLNRSQQRMQEPQRLRDGDRIEIGRYVIAVRIEPEASPGGRPDPAAPEFGPGGREPSSGPDFWAPAGDSAPPISRRDLRPPRDLKPVRADFSEWAVDVPSDPFGPAPGSAGPAPGRDEMSWAVAAPEPLPPLPPPVPSPRRPAGPAADLDPWGAAPIAAPAGLPPAPPPLPAPLPEPEIGAWGVPSLARPLPSEPPRPAAPDPAPPDPLGPARVVAPAPAFLEVEPLPAEMAGGMASDGAFMARFAAGAGIPVETLAWREPGDFAEDMGAFVRLAAENLKQLLAARAETKRVARTGGQTMIQALDNNPLKFSPTIDDALRIMLGRPTGGYLDARRAAEAGFRDLKTHQVKTYSAMQHALRLLMDELDPDVIEGTTEGDRGGIGGLLGSKKAKLWDLYCARWDALAAPHEEGMIDAFMVFFAECYDRGGGK